MKTIKYRDYSIVVRGQRPDLCCMIYDDEGQYLDFQESVDNAKDWIDAEQAGEHDTAVNPECQ